MTSPTRVAAGAIAMIDAHGSFPQGRDLNSVALAVYAAETGIDPITAAVQCAFSPVAAATLEHQGYQHSTGNAGHMAGSSSPSKLNHHHQQVYQEQRKGNTTGHAQRLLQQVFHAPQLNVAPLPEDPDEQRMMAMFSDAERRVRLEAKRCRRDWLAAALQAKQSSAEQRQKFVEETVVHEHRKIRQRLHEILETGDDKHSRGIAETPSPFLMNATAPATAGEQQGNQNHTGNRSLSAQGPTAASSSPVHREADQRVSRWRRSNSRSKNHHHHHGNEIEGSHHHRSKDGSSKEKSVKAHRRRRHPHPFSDESPASSHSSASTDSTDSDDDGDKGSEASDGIQRAAEKERKNRRRQKQPIEGKEERGKDDENGEEDHRPLNRANQRLAKQLEQSSEELERQRERVAKLRAIVDQHRAERREEPPPPKKADYEYLATIARRKKNRPGYANTPNPTGKHESERRSVPELVQKKEVDLTKIKPLSETTMQRLYKNPLPMAPEGADPFPHDICIRTSLIRANQNPDTHSGGALPGNYVKPVFSDSTVKRIAVLAVNQQRSTLKFLEKGMWQEQEAAHRRAKIEAHVTISTGNFTEERGREIFEQGVAKRERVMQLANERYLKAVVPSKKLTPEEQKAMAHRLHDESNEAMKQHMAELARQAGADTRTTAERTAKKISAAEIKAQAERLSQAPDRRRW